MRVEVLIINGITSHPCWRLQGSHIDVFLSSMDGFCEDELGASSMSEREYQEVMPITT